MTDDEIHINRRIVIVDDMASIHEDIRKVLGPTTAATDELDALEADLFGPDSGESNGGDTAHGSSSIVYEIDSAFQGEEGCKLVQAAVDAERPYAVAFVDMRMPPGWDGLKTIEELWRIDRALQVVICSAYSDHSWSEIMQRLGSSDRLLILKKPFDPVEVAQLAHTLTHKWSMQREVTRRLSDLDRLVREQTTDLRLAHEKLKSEVAERERIEEELRLAQKLEAVGQLGAGIAHEINTPIQFIGDSLHFLSDACGDVQTLVRAYQEALAALEQDERHHALVNRIRQQEEDLDLDYLHEQIPKACTRGLTGVERVTGIVRAMKEFSHPGREKVAANINELLRNTLMVAENEYKYVAKVETNLTDIPFALCHPGELGQVFLNLIVNAAHAIADVSGDSESTGTIAVRTHEEEGAAVVQIADSGGGIPEDIRHRVFDPFFTTKEVGKGTGQGLAVARRIVVEKHGGSIGFKSIKGEGTTFTIRIPFRAKETPNIPQAAIG